jgi:hypothetical protein
MSVREALEALAEAVAIEPDSVDSVLFWAEHDRIEVTADGVLYVFTSALEEPEPLPGENPEV